MPWQVTIKNNKADKWSRLDSEGECVLETTVDLVIAQLLLGGEECHALLLKRNSDYFQYTS